MVVKGLLKTVCETLKYRLETNKNYLTENPKVRVDVHKDIPVREQPNQVFLTHSPLEQNIKRQSRCSYCSCGSSSVFETTTTSQLYCTSMTCPCLQTTSPNGWKADDRGIRQSPRYKRMARIFSNTNLLTTVGF